MAGREFKDTYTIEALLTGNVTRLKSAITRAKKLLDSLDDGEGVQIDGDSKPLQRSIKVAKARLSTLNKEKAEMDIDADTTAMNSKINKSFDLVDMLQKKASVIEMNAKGLDRLKEIQSIKVREVDLNGAKVKVSPEFESNVAEAKIGRFRKLLRSVPERIKTWASVDVDKGGVKRAYHAIQANFTEPFNRRMGELATNIRTFATVFGNMIKGSLIASMSALVPIIAGATSAFMALGNAIGVSFGGAIGSAGALAIAFGGVATYGGLVASVLTRYNDEAFVATEASNRFTKALETIKSSWSGIVDSHIDTIFQTMGQAIYGANHALQAMTPFIDGVVASVGRLTDRFKNFMTESIIMEDFFNNMNTVGVKIFDNIGNAALSFTEGLFDSMNGLMPLFEWVSQGLNNLAEQFSGWAQRMAGENGFEPFINYVIENLPKIGRIFGNTFLGIIDMFAAFGQNSSHVFDGLERMTVRFREWAAALSESTAFQNFVSYIETHGPTIISLIGNIISTIVNLGIALAPLGAAVLSVTNSIFQFTSELLANNPIIGEMIGWLTVLAGAFMIVVPAAVAVFTAIQGLLAPIMGLIAGFRQTVVASGLLSAIGTTLTTAFSVVNLAIVAVVGIVLLLVSTFMYLWETNEGFRTRVIEIWTQIKEYISQAISAVSAFIMEVWGRLVQWWNENNELIVTYLTDAWNRILTVVEVTMAILVPIIQVAWEVIKVVIQVAMEIILGIITTVMAIINGDWSAAWGIIKETVSNVWTLIKDHISTVIEILKPIILEWVTLAYQWISEKFTQVKEFVTTVWESIKEVIRSKIQEVLQNIIMKFTEIVMNIRTKLDEAKQAVITKFTEMVTNARNKVTEIVTAVRDKFTEVVTAIRNKLTEAASTLVSKFSEMVSEAVSFFSNLVSETVSGMSNFVSEIISGGANAVSEMVTIGGNIVSAVGDFVGDMVSAGSDLIMGLVEGIKGAAGDAVEAAKGVASDAIAGAKKMLGIASPSKVFRRFGEWTMEGLEIGIERMAKAPVKAVNNVASKMNNVNIASQMADTLKRNKSLPIKQIQSMTSGMKTAMDGFNPSLQPYTADITPKLNSSMKSLNSRIDGAINVHSDASSQRVEVIITPNAEWIRADIADKDSREARNSFFE